jgi:hypothetical protein
MLALPSMQTIETAALTVAGTLLLGIFWALVNANIRHWTVAKGHDVYLLRLWDLLPDWGRKLLAGWSPLRQLWWLWLCLGLSGGIGPTLWLLAPQTSAPTSASDIAKAIMPMQQNLDAIARERDDLRDQLGALQRHVDMIQHSQGQPAAGTPAPIVEPTKTSPHYTVSEIDTMLGTLGQLRDFLGARQRQPDKDLMRLISSVRRIGPGPRPSPPSPSEAAQVADNIESYAHNLAEDSDKINDRLGEAPLLKAELSSTVIGSQEKIRKLTVSIFEMASILRQAAKNVSNDASIGPFITQQNNDLDAALNEYNQWLEDSIKKIEAKTREIRGWR